MPVIFAKRRDAFRHLPNLSSVFYVAAADGTTYATALVYFYREAAPLYFTAQSHDAVKRKYHQIYYPAIRAYLMRQVFL